MDKSFEKELKNFNSVWKRVQESRKASPVSVPDVKIMPRRGNSGKTRRCERGR